MPRTRDRRAGKEPLTAEEEALRNKNLKKNRESATKCRQSKRNSHAELQRNARELETVHNPMLKDMIERTLDEHIDLCNLALHNVNIPHPLKEHIREIYQRAVDMKNGRFFGVDVPNHPFPWIEKSNRKLAPKRRVEIAIDFRRIHSHTPDVTVRPSEEPPLGYMLHSAVFDHFSTSPWSCSAPLPQQSLPTYDSTWIPPVAEVEGSSRNWQLPTPPIRSQIEYQMQTPLPWVCALPILPDMSSVHSCTMQSPPTGEVVSLPSSESSSPPERRIPRLDDGHEMCTDGLVKVGEFDQVSVLGLPDTNPQYSTFDGVMILGDTHSSLTSGSSVSGQTDSLPYMNIGHIDNSNTSEQMNGLSIVDQQNSDLHLALDAESKLGFSPTFLEGLPPYP